MNSGEEKLKRFTFRRLAKRRKPTFPTIETLPESGRSDMSHVASPRTSSASSAVSPQPSVVSSGKRVVTKRRSATPAAFTSLRLMPPSILPVRPKFGVETRVIRPQRVSGSVDFSSA